ncbi:MAG: BtpA/SgcQ family protein [Aigarchaeota archaeon]|nr:BtpA/SgcQ family protein [Aigarchaeota archaeon]
MKSCRNDVLQELFAVELPIIGMVHLQPLPGAPRYRGEAVDDIVELALRDAEALSQGGVNGLIVENMMDAPFLKMEDLGHETVAAMAAAAREIRKTVELPIGINCLANAVIPSIAVAAASGARWVRANLWANAYIADEGYVEAAAPKALRYRSFLKQEHLKIFADVAVKHGSHFITSDRPLKEQVKDVEFFDADVLVVSGVRTGTPPSIERLREVKSVATLPVLVGSGLEPGNASQLLAHGDGAIVGTFFKKAGRWRNPVDKQRVETLLRVVKRMRRRRG